jgi:hypothetical protein
MVATIAILQKLPVRPESAARLPSAIIGACSVALFAAIVWLLAGPWAALAASFMFAFYPEAIRQSRTAGLYSAQLLLGVVALGAGWLATSRASPHLSSAPLDLVRRWAWVAIALAAFLGAGLAHLSAGLVLAAYGVWMLLLAAAALWISGRSTIASNLAVQVVIVGIAAGVLLLIVKPELFALIRDKIGAVPPPALDHAAVHGSGRGFHVFALSAQFAWVMSLLPLLVLLVLRQYPWLTLYLTLWFVIPLVANSLFIARKEERLLLFAAPALFVLAGLALNEARQGVARVINLHAREWLATYRSAVRLGDSVVWFLVAFALLTLPALGIAMRIPQSAGSNATSDWIALRRVFEESQGGADIPLGSVEPFAALLYLGRSDFAVGAQSGALPTEIGSKLPAGRFRLAADTLPRESLSGAVLARTLPQLQGAFASAEDVHLVVSSRALSERVVDSSIRSALDGASELCRDRCGELRLFRIKLGEADSTTTSPADTTLTRGPGGK